MQPTIRFSIAGPSLIPSISSSPTHCTPSRHSLLYLDSHLGQVRSTATQIPEVDVGSTTGAAAHSIVIFFAIEQSASFPQLRVCYVTSVCANSENLRRVNNVAQ